MMRRGGLQCLGAAIALVFLGPASAEAKGIVLITHGDTIALIGPLKAEFREHRKLRGSDINVGFRYDYFGIFWLDLWTWGGEYCLYDDKNYEPIPPNKAALLMGIAEGDLTRPFNYRFPIGLLILLGILAVAVPLMLLRKPPQDRLTPLLQDPRYVKALEILAAEQKRLAEAGTPEAAEGKAADLAFQAAVDHLTSEGIPREEAQQNLTFILAATAPKPT
jgi:hypothetical protein